MSVQLEALADEVFGAATAQARLGATSKWLPYGEVISNPDYRDLFFLNGVETLTAPDWTTADLERAVREVIPQARSFRASSREPKTVASLGPRLVASGYRHDVRVAMIQSFVAPALEDRSRRLEFVGVLDGEAWADFERSLDRDGREHGWTAAMIQQMIALSRWRSANTPHRYFVAYDSGRPAGHVGLFQHGQTAYLHALYTWPDARRHGVGSGLTRAMSEEASRMGCDRLALQCSDDGYLPRFYARLGFRPVGEQHIWTTP